MQVRMVPAAPLTGAWPGGGGVRAAYAALNAVAVALWLGWATAMCIILQRRRKAQQAAATLHALWAAMDAPSAGPASDAAARLLSGRHDAVDVIELLASRGVDASGGASMSGRARVHPAPPLPAAREVADVPTTSRSVELAVVPPIALTAARLGMRGMSEQGTSDSHVPVSRLAWSGQPTGAPAHDASVSADSLEASEVAETAPRVPAQASESADQRPLLQWAYGAWAASWLLHLAATICVATAAAAGPLRGAARGAAVTVACTAVAALAWLVHDTVAAVLCAGGLVAAAAPAVRDGVGAHRSARLVRQGPDADEQPSAAASSRCTRYCQPRARAPASTPRSLARAACWRLPALTVLLAAAPVWLAVATSAPAGAAGAPGPTSWSAVVAVVSCLGWMAVCVGWWVGAAMHVLW
jgi:hypothetical protein